MEERKEETERVEIFGGWGYSSAEIKIKHQWHTKFHLHYFHPF